MCSFRPRSHDLEIRGVIASRHEPLILSAPVPQPGDWIKSRGLSTGVIAPSYRLDDRECLRRGFEHEASPDWRGGGCRADLLGTRLGATGKPVGRKRWGSTGSQPRRARAYAIQHGSSSPGCSPRGDGTSPYGYDAATIFDVGDQLGDAAKASLFASYLAWQDGGASLRQG